MKVLQKKKICSFILLLCMLVFNFGNLKGYANTGEYTYRVIITSIYHNTDWWYTSSGVSGKGHTLDGREITATKIVNNNEGKSGNWGYDWFANNQCYFDLTFNEPVEEIEINWSGWDYNWATKVKIVSDGKEVETNIDNKQGWCKTPRIEGETQNQAILNVEPEKTKIKKMDTVTANLTIDNIKDIAAEDIRIKYDSEKLQYVGQEEVDGIKLIKDDKKDGELRFIVASKGEANIVNAKKILLKLKFKGIKAGEALVDVTKGRVSDGIEIEKDLTDAECGEATIIIEDLKDVNNSGEFTLLDLGIDARHFSKDPKATELANYNTDIVINNAIDENDLLEIGKLMLENPNYQF